MLSFRSVAETWRVIGKSRKRTEFIANNLVASSMASGAFLLSSSF